MQRYYKKNEITFDTNMRAEEVLEIANDYIKENDPDRYIRGEESVRLDINDAMEHEMSWVVTIDLPKESGFLDCEYRLVISDKSKVIKYIINNHGIIRYLDD